METPPRGRSSKAAAASPWPVEVKWDVRRGQLFFFAFSEGFLCDVVAFPKKNLVASTLKGLAEVVDGVFWGILKQIRECV